MGIVAGHDVEEEPNENGRSVDQTSDLDLVNEDLLAAKAAGDRRDQPLIKPAGKQRKLSSQPLVERTD